MTLLFCGRLSNIPRYLPRTTRAASLLCILMRTAPLEPCDTAAIAAAVFSSSLSLGTSKTALTITLTRWPSSSSSRTWTLGPHVTALLMLGKAIAFTSRKTRSRLTSARSAARPTIARRAGEYRYGAGEVLRQECGRRQAHHRCQHQQGGDVGAERPGPRGGRGRPSRQGYRQRCFAGPERQARREHSRRDRGSVAGLQRRGSHQDAQQAGSPCRPG